MLIQTSILGDKVNERNILRILLIVVLAMVMYTLLLQPVTAKADNCKKAGPIISARAALEDALAQSVDAYKDFWQTVGTALYNSNSEALDTVLGCDDLINEAAAEYGVDKAVIQALLFQELRFLNIFDEVDICVQNTYLLLHQRETTGVLSASVIEPVFTGFYSSDSSTGLGQIYAKTAIKALNWYHGAPLYDYDNWKDREEIWLRLKYDDAYNIKMVALICRYNEYILADESHIADPSVRDILRIYNGSGSSAEKYADVTYQYYEAFERTQGDGSKPLKKPPCVQLTQ